MKKLIIKTGLSETFDLPRSNLSNVPPLVSLGDVLRTTIVLHLLNSNNQITWFTSKEAAPLLKNLNREIDIVTSWSEINFDDFETIFNFERDDETLNRLNSISNRKPIVGFFRDADQRVAINNIQREPYPFETWLQKRQIQKMNWSEKLYELMGKKWNGENYYFKANSNSVTRKSATIKIGLNWKVGGKWPSKSWPIEKWQELRKLIDQGPLSRSDCEVSWQEGLNDLSEYIDWIDSCDLVITHDSLGLHLAMATNKKIIGLFGPTSPKEIPNYQNLVILHSNKEKGFGCMPCYLSRCDQATHCMTTLEMTDVLNALSDFLD